MRRIVLLVAAAALMPAAAARADSRLDVGLLLGSTSATKEGTVLNFDRGTTYQAAVAWRVWNSSTVDLAIEVPFIATPAFTVLTPNQSLPLEYASLYLTPGIRITVLKGKPIAVFGSVGGGYARYTESTLRADRSPNPAQEDTNTGAVQFAGGIEIRPPIPSVRWLAFRGELRDIYTGSRRFSIPTPAPDVHNVVGSGGLVIKF